MGRREDMKSVLGNRGLTYSQKRLCHGHPQRRSDHRHEIEQFLGHHRALTNVRGQLLGAVPDYRPPIPELVP